MNNFRDNGRNQNVSTIKYGPSRYLRVLPTLPTYTCPTYRGPTQYDTTTRGGGGMGGGGGGTGDHEVRGARTPRLTPRSAEW